MNHLYLEKKKYRQVLKERRRQINQQAFDQLSHALNYNLINYIKKQNITRIKGFIPYNKEPNIWDFIDYCWQHQIEFIVPRCDVATKTMTWYSINHRSQLVEGAYHILEPDPIQCKQVEEKVDTVLVPALAFTQAGERLGYGGGYYDRFYEQVNDRQVNWIGINFELFIEPYLPTEKHDFKCNFIVTNAGVMDCKIEEKGSI